MKKNRPPKSGFTLIEILIVVAILGLLMVALLLSFKSQREKAEDARVKADLDRLKIAFEDYYNDHNCYPPDSWFDTADDCGSALLQPYLGLIPCDPKTDLPYQLEFVGDQCSGFRLYATLENLSDPSLSRLCVAAGGSTLGNYGVSSTNTTVAIDCSASPTPTPSNTPNPTPGPYACHGGICNNFGTPNSCPLSFISQAECEAYCPTPGAIDCD